MACESNPLVELLGGGDELVELAFEVTAMPARSTTGGDSS
jgi:hypothetical protein